MLRLSKLFLFSISILVLSSWLYPEDAYLVRVRVYQGKVMEDVPSEKNEALWRTSQEPLLSSLVDVVASPDPEWSANVTRVLFDLADLETLSELFSVSRGWDGRSRDWLDRFLGSDVVFRLETSARKSRIQDFSIRATLFRSKEGVIPKDESLETRARRALESGSNPKKMDKIFENALELSLDDPVVVRSPLEEGALFVVIAVTKNIGQTKKEVSKTSKSGLEIVESQIPLEPIQPYYPDSLRERRIEGKVGLLIAIDKSGAVIGTRVTQSLHPYLDYSVVQAVIQERFSPIFKNGKPVEAVFPYEYRFEHLAGALPERDEQPDGTGMTDSGRLATVLAGSADYCRSLSDSMLDYVCEETINEIGYRLREDPQLEVDYYKTFGPIRTNLGVATGAVSARLTLMDPQLTTRTRFLCDYQIVKDRDLIKERRIILKRDGKKIPEGIVLEEKRYSVLMPILKGVRILSTKRQGLFTFRLIGDGKFQGRPCDIVEAFPKSGNDEGTESAKIWIDKENYRILKCEIEGVPIEGFEEVLADCAQLGIHPRFVTTCEYGTQYKTVSLPSHTAVRIEYPVSRSLGGLVLKSTIDTKYSKYRYFDVKTEHSLIK